MTKAQTRTILTMIFRMSPIIKGKIIANNTDRTYAEENLNKNVQRVIKGK